MNTTERRFAILQWIADRGEAKVEELAAHYAVSAVTIRNDLNVLSDKGKVMRTHGGASPASKPARESVFNEKRSQNSNRKVAVARAAARLINDGDKVFLDSGTTTGLLASELEHHKHLVVMTNGLNIANTLSQFAGTEVMMTGGTLRKKSLSFYGTQAEEALRYYRFDKLFLGVDGFDMSAGVTTHFDREASLNRVMCDICTRIIVVTDSSKFARRGHHFIRSAGEFHTLVTDSDIPAEYLNTLRQNGVQVIIADD